MARPRKEQTPTVEEVKPVLPNQQQAAKPAPMQGFRRLQQARAATGQGRMMGNLMGLQARQSPWSNNNG